MLSLEGHGFNRCSGNHASTSGIGPPEKKKKFSVGGDPVCNLHWDWATTTALPLGDFTFTFHFDALEKEMATHSSIAWRIPGTGEPGGLPSLGSHRVGHD